MSSKTTPHQNTTAPAAANTKINGKRTITYRIGWKKGFIEVGEDGNIVARSPQSLKPIERLMEQMLNRVAWRRLPFIPASAVTTVMWLLPAVSFCATIWLVYALLND